MKGSIVSCISSSPDNFCPLDPEVTVLSYELFYEVRMELRAYGSEYNNISTLSLEKDVTLLTMTKSFM